MALLLPKPVALVEPNEGAGVVPAPNAGVEDEEPNAGAGVVVVLAPKVKPALLWSEKKNVRAYISITHG